MATIDNRLTFAERLALLVDTTGQPTVRELYSSGSFDGDSHLLFSSGRDLTSEKSIVVYGDNQYFGDANSDLVIGQILKTTPSAYMAMIESLQLIGCGFAVHELHNDGHVCKYADRHSYLDCAHSLGRKVLETALALVANDRLDDRSGAQNDQDERFAAFAMSEHGLVRLDRSLGEVARGPLREDSIAILSSETQLSEINERTEYSHLMEMLCALKQSLRAKQAEYAAPLLRLAGSVAPELFQVLRWRLGEWANRPAGTCPEGRRAER